VVRFLSASGALNDKGINLTPPAVLQIKKMHAAGGGEWEFSIINSGEDVRDGTVYF